MDLRNFTNLHGFTPYNSQARVWYRQDPAADAAAPHKPAVSTFFPRSYSGFTLFETLLYLGIFSIMALGLLMFNWNISDLGVKENVSRQTASDARFVTERLNGIIRASSAIDTDASVFDDADGRLVLAQPDSSDTITISVVDGRVTVMGTASDPVALHSAATAVSELRFERRGTAADGSEYVGFTVTLRSIQSVRTRAPYNAYSTIGSGALLRNQSL